MAAFIGGLALRQRRPDRLVLTLPAAHRVVFAVLSALCAFVLLFGVLFEGEPTVLLARNVPAGLLTLAMLFGLLYEDRWTFDRAGGRVENRFGTLPIARRTGFAMADLARIGIERFTRGRQAEEAPATGTAAAPGSSPLAEGVRGSRRWGQQPIVRLVAEDRGGGVHVLDMGPAPRLEQLRARGLRLAGFCGVEFADETAGRA